MLPAAIPPLCVTFSNLYYGFALALRRHLLIALFIFEPRILNPDRFHSPSHKMLQVILFVLLAFFSYSLDALLQFRQAAFGKKIYAGHNRAIMHEKAENSHTSHQVMPSHNIDKTFILCIARHANVTPETQHAWPTRMADIVKICIKKHGSSQRSVLNRKVLMQKKGLVPSIKASRNFRRISGLLNRAKTATLQYIYSRLNKVLFSTTNPDSPGFTCRVASTSIADIRRGTRQQRRLVRTILKLLEKADDDTRAEICRKLENLLSS